MTKVDEKAIEGVREHYEKVRLAIIRCLEGTPAQYTDWLDNPGGVTAEHLAQVEVELLHVESALIRLRELMVAINGYLRDRERIGTVYLEGSVLKTIDAEARKFLQSL